MYVNDVTKFFYIIDGGMLLHRLKWEKNEKFTHICQRYTRYLRNNYGTGVKVVFDGYNNDGTKASERSHRYITPDDKEMFFLKPLKNNTLQQVYSTKTMLMKYPNITKNHLFFIHAFAGFNTTSAFYNKEKNNFIKIFNNDQKLRAAAETFMVEEQSEEVLLNEGMNCILTIYGAKTVKNLNEIRYERFIALASKNKSVQISSLPPTEDAAKQHIKRVYLQVQQLKNNTLIPPEEWGWQKDNYLKPIKMKQPAAPINKKWPSPACIVCSGSDCDNHPPLEEDEVFDTQNINEN
ncbi:hypothetical protein ILUMI_14300 [Ignelater luminosus]|uniref:Uncharacterized protein n=1 Tax=Ignelater luminosus TaxID=2038154 RepID=A0A8K0CQR5_IGNLU|nr:hypothetical protein ILUMI_14300 [Ignelater luminosus]